MSIATVSCVKKQSKLIHTGGGGGGVEQKIESKEKEYSYLAFVGVENSSKHHNSARKYVTGNKIIETLGGLKLIDGSYQPKDAY